ncbi:MAG: Fur family transcriptional regulator [Desulfitobacteriaceae bacterium]|nr:Fur family transcriptional regulator [Desulfitobacteriaceae bacterium]MDI6912822.1 Fur family transcriptional regulator [Desulfitobacteriaceae bacterium]
MAERFEQMDAYSDICNIMRNRAYKLTPQRQTVLKIFLKHADQHLSAEDVYQLVKPLYPDIGMATVYRTLDIFADLGVLQKNDFGDGRSRYEFSRQDEHHHHHHLICLRCGSVSEFDDDLLESLETMIGKRNKFKVVDHVLKFYGYCEKCQAEMI